MNATSTQNLSLLEELQINGVAIIKSAIKADDVHKLKLLIEEFKIANSDHWSHAVGADGLARRIVNLHLAIPEFSHTVASCEDLCNLTSSFFDGEPRIYTSLFFEGGSEQPIHRDTPYFVTVPERRFLGVWLALEATSEANGALEVIKRGHLAGEPDRQSIAGKYYDDPFKIAAIDDNLWKAYQENVIGICEAKGLVPEVIPIEAGDIIVWHPDLPHGGSKITKPGLSRKSIVFHVTPQKCPVYHMELFFNPLRDCPKSSSWVEEPVLPSQDKAAPHAVMHIAKTSDEVSFAHVHNVKLCDLK